MILENETCDDDDDDEEEEEEEKLCIHTVVYIYILYCIYRYISPSHDGLRLDLMFFFWGGPFMKTISCALIMFSCD